MLFSSILAIPAPFGRKVSGSPLPSTTSHDPLFQGCQNITFQNLLAVLQLSPVLISALFSALRTFAVLNRNYVVSSLVLALGLVPVFTNLPVLNKEIFYYVDDPILGSSCYGMSGLSSTADLSVLLILNVTQLVMGVIPDLTEGNPVAIISNIIQPILVSRFLINLRHVNESLEGGTALSSTHFSDPRFRSQATITIDEIIGPMGGPLEHGNRALWLNTPALLTLAIHIPSRCKVYPPQVIWLRVNIPLRNRRTST
ncbi:hypothetical protein NM688_g433 [Phlebia brevispora]|uniref:Uncharacterized protein n=1 Tax=Phlebia brevispora TaxID=194682 RepID=A0ACC1TEC9_9APHY|nr:hypothetical protein NM688_g433 [Phlebia brevispora]